MKPRVTVIGWATLAPLFWAAEAAWCQPTVPADASPRVGYFVEGSQESVEGALVFYACTGGPTVEGEWRGHIRLYGFGIDAGVAPPKPAYPVWQEKTSVTLSGDVQFTVPREAGAFEGSGRLEMRVSGNSGSFSAVHRLPLRRSGDRQLDLYMVPGTKPDPLRLELRPAVEECLPTGSVPLRSRERQSAREMSALPPTAQESFRQAFKDFGEGRLDRATASLEELARTYPRNATVLYNLATALAMTGDRARAAETCRHVLELNPNYADAYTTLGLALFEAGQADEAVASVEQAVKLDPTYLNGWFTLHQMFEQRGLAVRAAWARQQLEAQVPCEDREVDLLVKSLNWSSLQAGQPEEARPALERALRWDPYSPLTLRNLGALALFRGDADEAVRLLSLSRQIEPQHARTWYNLGHAYRAKGDVDNAVACYRRYVELERDPAERGRVENAKALIQQLTH